MATTNGLAVRGFLLHITHYDPVWIQRKSREKPFDLKLGLEIIDALARNRFNTVVIDCKDGVRYKSHPELKRHYSVPMGHLEKLVARAHGHGLDVVPKLNFSQGTEGHNLWFRPHDDLFDNAEYWKYGFELIDELIHVCRPKRYFHVGMDEDLARAHTQYVEAIRTLHAGLKKRKLKTVIWNDSALTGRHLILGEKSLMAEKKIPKDLVEVPWCYWLRIPQILRRLVKQGFEVWGAPGRDPAMAREWKKDLEKTGAKGVLITRWIPTQPKNRKELLGLINTMGPIFCG